MNKARIETNRKNIELAKSLLETAFEDLKNVDEFRDNPASSKPHRERILAMVAELIRITKEIERKHL